MLKEEIPDRNMETGETGGMGAINWRIEKSQEQFRVKHVGLSFVGFLIAFLTFFILGFLLYNFIKIKPLNMVMFIFMLVIDLIILCVMIFVNKESKSKGDWLIYDLNNAIVSLPRIPVDLKKKDIKLIQVIVGLPGFPNRFLTEVNLVVHGNAGYERYSLIKAGSPNLVKKLVLELSEVLSVDIQKVKYSLSGKKTITNGW